MFVNQRVKKNIEDLANMVYEIDPQIRLINGETDEVINVDSAAIRAGFIAGVIVAEAVIEGKMKDVGIVKQIASGIGVAGEIYVDLRGDVELAETQDD